MTDDDKDMLYIIGIFVGFIIAGLTTAGLWALIR